MTLEGSAQSTPVTLLDSRSGRGASQCGPTLGTETPGAGCSGGASGSLRSCARQLNLRGGLVCLGLSLWLPGEGLLHPHPLIGLWVPTLQPEPSRPRLQVSVTIEDLGSPKGQVGGREPAGNLSNRSGVRGQGRASVQWGHHWRTFAPAHNQLPHLRPEEEARCPGVAGPDSLQA